MAPFPADHFSPDYAEARLRFLRAAEARRARTLSAREVRMMGTRAPSTIPAASAFARTASPELTRQGAGFARYS